MSDHLSERHVKLYRQKTLSPAELLAVSDHVAACESCRQKVADAGRLRTAFASLRTELQAASQKPDHLAYEQLASYVDGELGEIDREIVNGHLELCTSCQADVNDLRAFRAMMSVHPAKEHAPVQPPTVWAKFLDFWRAPAHWIPLHLISTTGVAVLYVWIATHSTQSSPEERWLESSPPQQTPDPMTAQLTTQLQQAQENLQEQEKKVQTLEHAKQQSDKTIETLKQQNAQLMAQRPSSAPRTWGFGGGEKSSSDNARKEVEALKGKGAATAGSAGEGFRLISPVSTVVLSDRPTFSWEALEGATRYHVTVLDANGKEVAIALLPSSDVSWTIPPSRLALPRGGVYRWQVAATRVNDGKEEEIISPRPDQPEAKFKVLGQKEKSELDTKQKNAKSPLELSKLYIDYGLLADAERELRAFRLSSK